MNFIENFPFFSIMLSMGCAILSAVVGDKAAKWISVLMLSAVSVLSVILLGYTLTTEESFTYMMGHYPAPWGNELRAGILEAMLAVMFSVILLLNILSGMSFINKDIENGKRRLYFVIVDMLMGALLALVYTNDLFTGYVFIEITTIAACGLIAIRRIGRVYVGAARYMVMSQIGSGLVLIGLAMLYSVTGHLLMENTKNALTQRVLNGEYEVPVLVVLTLISVGLAIKSGLFPFHSWMPDAYGYSITPSSAILSGLISKSYIVLLIKIFYRVMGLELIASSKLLNILFVFALCAMFFGSMRALKEKDIRRMNAYSSVAQIGYIYMGIGLGNEAGMVAAVFYIFVHAMTKSLLFLSSGWLSEVSSESRKIPEMAGAARRCKVAGVGFTVGALSMIGMPFLAGFVSKIMFASAAFEMSAARQVPVLLMLAVSTLMNVFYYLKTVIWLWLPVDEKAAGQKAMQAAAGQLYESRKKKDAVSRAPVRMKVSSAAAMITLMVFNIIFGLFPQPIVALIDSGLKIFS